MEAQSNSSEDAQPPDQADDPPPNPPPDRRFLGGAATWELHRFHLPLWGRVFFLSVAVVVSAALLATVIAWRLRPASSDLDIHIIAASATADSAETPDPRAEADCRILAESVDHGHSFPTTAKVTIPGTPAEFLKSLGLRPANRRRRTSVLFLRTHVFADEHNLFFLPNGHLPGQIDTSSALSVPQLLTQLAESKYSNILLILDTVPVDDFRNGRFSRNPAPMLQQELERWEQTADAPPSLTVVASFPPDGSRASSPRFQHTLLPALLAYTLQGGLLADSGPPGQPVSDGELTAGEAARFLANTLGNWNRDNRRISQQPLVFQSGADFVLRAAQPGPTPAELLTGSPLTENSEDSLSAATPSQSAHGDGNAASTTPDTKQPTPANPNPSHSPDEATPEQRFLTLLQSHWQQVDTSFRHHAGAPPPATLALVIRELQIAERLLLENNLKHAEQRINRNLPLLLTQLTSNHSARDSLSPEPRLLQQALLVPADDTVARLTEFTDARSRMLARLATRCRVGNQWRHPELVKTLATIGQQLEELLRHADSTQLHLHRDSFRDLHQQLINCETLLIAGRSDDTTSAIHNLNIQLADLKNQLAESAQAAHDIQLVLFAMPQLLESLLLLERTSVFTGDAAPLLGKLMQAALAGSTGTLIPADDRQQLIATGGLAQACMQSFRRLTEDSLSTANWSAMQALLKQPLTPPRTRIRLLETLLSHQDASEISTAGSSTQPPPQDLSQARRLLDDLIRFHAVCSQRAHGDHAAFELPITTNPHPETHTETDPDISDFSPWVDALRHRHPATPTIGLRELHTNASASATMALLATCYWTTDTPAAADRINRMAADLRFPLQERLSEELRRNRELEHQLLPSPRLPAGLLTDSELGVTLQLVNSNGLTIVPGETITSSIRIRLLNGQPPLPNGTLLLDWDHRRCPLQVSILNVPAVDGHLACDLPEFSSSGDLEIPVVITCPADSEMQFAAEADLTLPMAIRLSLDGKTQLWPPVVAHVRPTRQPAATISAAWKSTSPATARIELLPGQALPLRLQVAVKRPLPDPLHIDFPDHPDVGHIPLPENAHTLAGTHDLAATELLQIPLAADNLRVRLRSGTQTVHELQLHVAVLDPVQCFDVRMSRDPNRAELTARVARIHQGDSSDPVSFSLHLQGDDQPTGRLTTELGPDDSQATLITQTTPLGPAAVELGINGVHRAFRFRFRTNDLLAEPETALTLAVASPPNFSRIAAASGAMKLPIELQLGSAGSVTLHAGIDENGDGSLQQSERQVSSLSTRGCQPSVILRATPGSPDWTVSAHAGNPTVQLDLSGRRGHVPVLVSAVDQQGQTSTTLNLFLLSEAPTVRISKPESGAAQATTRPLHVTLETESSLVPAIDDLEIGFDLNQDGMLSPEELSRPMNLTPGQQVKFHPNGRLSLQLPLPNPIPSLLPLRIRPVTTLPPAARTAPDQTPAAPPKDTPPAAILLPAQWATATFSTTANGTVEGHVQQPDGRPAANIGVQLSTGQRTTTDDQGDFRLAQVTPGICEITATSGGRSARGIVAVRAAEIATIRLTLYLK